LRAPPARADDLKVTARARERPRRAARVHAVTVAMATNTGLGDAAVANGPDPDADACLACTLWQGGVGAGPGGGVGAGVRAGAMVRAAGAARLDGCGRGERSSGAASASATSRRHMTGRRADRCVGGAARKRWAEAGARRGADGDEVWGHRRPAVLKNLPDGPRQRPRACATPSGRFAGDPRRRSPAATPDGGASKTAAVRADRPLGAMKPRHRLCSAWESEALRATKHAAEAWLKR
jgi:hypothetical protein